MDITWIGSPNFLPQFGIAKEFAVMHWMVGRLEGTDRSFQSASFKVATNYGIEDSIVHQYVQDRDYAFGSGTKLANARGISIEHSGGELNNGSRRHPSPGTHATSASLLALLSARHGWGTLTLGGNVFLHSHFVATECPGSLDVARIIEEANAILRDGKSNPQPDSGSNLIAVDGIYGVQTIRKLQHVLGFRGANFVDGIFGPVTAKRLQAKLDQVEDGNFGPVSIRALQRYLGVSVDGYWGPQTTRTLQLRLNAGTF